MGGKGMKGMVFQAEDTAYAKTKRGGCYERKDYVCSMIAGDVV